MADLPPKTSNYEMSFEETDASLSVISLADDDDDEHSPETKSTSGSHFCSTPVRTSYKQHCNNTGGNYDLGEPSRKDFCPSHGKHESAIHLTQDDDLTCIDTSMSSLSLVENDENRTSFQNHSLHLDQVSATQTLSKGTKQFQTLSASSKACENPVADLHMSIVKTEPPETLSSVSNVILRGTQKLAGTEIKTKVKAEGVVKHPKFVVSKVSSKLSKLLEFHPTVKKEKEKDKENKCSRRKKFLQKKQKKKLAAAREKEKEKENQPSSATNAEKLANLEKLNSQAEECADKDRKPVRYALQVIENWIGEAPPETKDSEKKVYEFVSDDQNENLDINDPEWDHIKCLKTDEERYKAVKDCWESRRAPNPQRDLTFHSFRKNRLKKCGNKPIHCKKRIATDKVGCGVVSKSRKTEEAPCTLFLDHKITEAKKQFTTKQNDNLVSFNQATENIEATFAQRREWLMIEYYKAVNRIKCMRLNMYCRNWFLRSLDTWLDKEGRCLDEDILKEKEKVKWQKEKTLTNLHNNHNFTLRKLEEARNEVLKFNQFYSGLNKIDPTILRGQFLEEIVALEDMYLIYEKNYGLSH